MSIICGNLPNLNETRRLTLVDTQENNKNISEFACDFVAKLLTKNPNERLGSRTNPENIKRHLFFGSIDWISLENDQLKPPFKPKVIHFNFNFFTNLYSNFYSF